MNGIIIAGGKATRLNGIPKGLIRVDAKPIIEHLIDIIHPYCKKIMIIANDRAYHYLQNVQIFSDIIKDIGPIGGIYTGLYYSDAHQNIILSCDMPYLSDKIIQKFIENKDKGNIIVSKTDNEIHPLCAIYSKKVLPVIESQIKKQEYKLKNILPQTNTYFVEFSKVESKFFTNINTPQELNKLLNNGKD